MTIVGIIALLLVLTIAGGGVWAYYHFLHTEPLSEAELAELTPDWDAVTHGNWSPWYDPGDGTVVWNPAGGYNAWVESLDARAWDGLIDVYYRYPELLGPDVSFAKPGEAGWDRTRALVGSPEADQAVEAIARAAGQRYLGVPMYGGDDGFAIRSSTDETSDRAEFAAMERHGVEGARYVAPSNPNLGLLGLENPQMSMVQRMSRLLDAHARVAIEDGSGAEFAESVGLIWRLGAYAEEFPTLIAQLTAMAIEGLGMDTIAWALEHHGEQLGDAELARLDGMLVSAQGRVFVWQGEALVFNDSVRRMLDDGGGLRFGGGRTGPGATFDQANSTPDSQLDASAQRMFYVYHRALSMPYPYQNGMTPDAFVASEAGNLNDIGLKMVEMLLPSLSRVQVLLQEHREETRSLRAILAMHRHRARHGEMPASLDGVDADLRPGE